MKSIVGLLMLSMTFSCAKMDNSVEGVIRDSGGVPIGGVQMRCFDAFTNYNEETREITFESKSTLLGEQITDESGCYSCEHDYWVIFNGKCDLRALIELRKTGYQPKDEFVRTECDAKLTLDLTMTPE